MATIAIAAAAAGGDGWAAPGGWAPVDTQYYQVEQDGAGCGLPGRRRAD